MSQETRKDPRAKIVSLNVRYKSATVDEFIEDHSFDVSKGGVFIKTATPFPTGTLLKFEMRLAGDQAVIAGVGRVVWRREPPDAGDERPAGMGVKFIKIDDKSREIIDRLIGAHATAGAAYQEGLAAAPPSNREPPTRPNASFPPQMSNISVPPRPGIPRPGAGSSVPPGKQTAVGLGPAGNAAAASTGKATLLGLSASTAPPPRSSNAPPAGKATMLGIGAPKLDDLKSVPPEEGGEPVKTSFFPESKEPHVPPKEATMMTHAAELLEEAFKEAGGKSEELGGTNPLFARAPGELTPIDVTAAPAPDSAPRSPSVRPRADSVPPSRRNSVPAPVSSASLLPAANPNRSKVVFGAVAAAALVVGGIVFLNQGSKSTTTTTSPSATGSSNTSTGSTASPASAIPTMSAPPTVTATPSAIPSVGSTTTSPSASAGGSPTVKASAAVAATTSVPPKASAVVKAPKTPATAAATVTATEGEPAASAATTSTAKTPKPKASASASAKAAEDDNPY